MRDAAIAGGTAGDNSTCIVGTTNTGCYDSCAALGKCGRCNWNTCYDDGAFVEAVVDDLDRAFGVDRSRLFVFGESNGGMAVHYLIASRLPGGLFLGAAPVFGLPLLGYAAGSPEMELLRRADSAKRTSIARPRCPRASPRRPCRSP